MEKASSGSAAAIFYISWEKDNINTALRASGHPEMQYVNLPIQTDSQVANGEKRMARQDIILSHDSWGLTNKCRNPEKLLALIDWACSDEGQIILNSGFEGEHWIRDSNGKRVWTDLFVQAKTDPSVNKIEGLGLMPGLPYFKVYAADGQPHDLTMEMEWIDGQGLSDREKEVFQKLGWSSSLGWYLDNHLKIIQTGLERTIYINPSSDLGDIHTKMTETRVKYTAPIMMAKTDAEFETAYQAAMAEYDRLDHQAVIDELNRLYREQANELKKYE
jgi:hypothetical protein